MVTRKSVLTSRFIALNQIGPTRVSDRWKTSALSAYRHGRKKSVNTPTPPREMRWLWFRQSCDLAATDAARWRRRMVNSAVALLIATLTSERLRPRFAKLETWTSALFSMG